MASSTPMSKTISRDRGVVRGRMLRPRKKVLDETALVPAENFTASPKTLTHALRKTQPYYYQPGSDSPDGSFAAGTEVKLLDHDDELAWVVNAQGLRVATEYKGLRALTAATGKRAKRPK
jgi:hypothetical protein